MIRNNFIRDEEGNWYSIVGLDRLIVVAQPLDYGDSTQCWKIEAVWLANGKELPLDIQSDFDSMEDAQEFLDKMMGL